MRNKLACLGEVEWFALVIVSLVATSHFLVKAGDASAQVLRQRIVSTSGIPHGDIANYQRSPYWHPGMPLGVNDAWREFLKTEIADITSGATVVLHQGDQVDGRWGRGSGGRRVFVGT